MLAITPMTDPKHNKIAKCLWLYKKKKHSDSNKNFFEIETTKRFPV
jgi:hypothetical protein